MSSFVFILFICHYLFIKINWPESIYMFFFKNKTLLILPYLLIYRSFWYTFKSVLSISTDGIIMAVTKVAKINRLNILSIVFCRISFCEQHRCCGLIGHSTKHFFMNLIWFFFWYMHGFYVALKWRYTTSLFLYFEKHTVGYLF